MIGIIAIIKIKNKFKIKTRVKRVNSIIRQKIKISNNRNEKQNCEKCQEKHKKQNLNDSEL